MKKHSSLSLLAIFLVLLFTSCHAGEIKDGTYHFEVYATNDLHGRFFDSIYISNESRSVHPHSLASVATTIKQARANIGEENVVLLDIGDHLQGDNAVFYYNFIDTVSVHIFPKVMNYLKYDAVVVGNHDIEPGQRVYDKVKSELAMPYLAANAIDIKTEKPYFQPYVILNKNGVKIAVIGVTSPNVPNWLSPHLWKDMVFEKIVPSLEYWVKEVQTKEDVHFVIVAMHAGLGDENSDSMDNPARFVAKNVKGIDLILAAHDHQVTAEKLHNGEKEIWILEGGSRASSLSKAAVELTIKDGKVILSKVTGEGLSMRGVQPDRDYTSFFRKEFVQVKEFTNRPVGMLNKDIASREAYFGSSAYIDMIHTLQLKASGADISFAAPLSFDAKIEKGMLNYQNLLDIYPFENQLNVIEMTGSEIQNYLEYSYGIWVNSNPAESGHLLNIKPDSKSGRMRFQHPSYNFDSAAGIIYEVDITKAKGERVHILSLSNGTDFHLNSIYKVALTSYRTSGGGYLLEKGAGIQKDQRDERIVARLADIREILYAQLQADGSIDAVKLNQWKFVPERLATQLAEKDAKLLFR